jgi:hypothetical protein
MITRTFVQSWHPSIKTIIEKMPERGMYSPYAYVEYWPDNKKHGHQHQLGAGYDEQGVDNHFVNGGGIEEAAEDLATLVADCRPGKHKGHIREQHTEEEQELAFKDATEQLQTIQYDRQWAHQLWMENMEKKWGGAIPAGVILPTTSMDEWQLMIPNYHGDPVLYNLRSDVQKDMQELATDPGKLERAEVGYKVKTEQNTERKLRMHRKLTESKRRRQLTD